jgi:hypothetical protein
MAARTFQGTPGRAEKEMRENPVRQAFIKAQKC